MRTDSYAHAPRCDRDLCAPDCPVRANADVNDLHFPGRNRAGDTERRLRIERHRACLHLV